MPSEISKSQFTTVKLYLEEQTPLPCVIEILCNSTDSGGLEVLDYESLNYSFKVNFFFKENKKQTR